MPNPAETVLAAAAAYVELPAGDRRLPGLYERLETAINAWRTTKEVSMAWTDTLDDRDRKEIAWSRMYAAEYGHGITGHNQLLLIAHLAELLDQMETGLRLAQLRAVDSAADPQQE